MENGENKKEIVLPFDLNEFDFLGATVSLTSSDGDNFPTFQVYLNDNYITVLPIINNKIYTIKYFLSTTIFIAIKNKKQ